MTLSRAQRFREESGLRSAAFHRITDGTALNSDRTVRDVKFPLMPPALTVTGAIGAKESLLTARAREKATECFSRLLRKRRAR